MLIPLSSFSNFHLSCTRQCKKQKTALENSNTSMYVDFHHNLGEGMYINWISKSRNPRNSNLVRKNRENNYFSSCTKLEVLRYQHTTKPFCHVILFVWLVVMNFLMNFSLSHELFIYISADWYISLTRIDGIDYIWDSLSQTINTELENYKIFWKSKSYVKIVHLPQTRNRIILALEWHLLTYLFF